MPTFVIIAGAPGAGKSTISWRLQQKLGAPLFEFGWIPEFRNTGSRKTTYVEDEAIAFENLALVVKNYAKHGFKNILITDLQNERIEQLEHVFTGYEYSIFTLRVRDEETLKSRVLAPDRSSGYRDWRESLRLNRQLLSRKRLLHEEFIDVDGYSAEEIVTRIVARLDPAGPIRSMPPAA